MGSLFPGFARPAAPVGSAECVCAEAAAPGSLARDPDHPFFESLDLFDQDDIRTALWTHKEPARERAFRYGKSIPQSRALPEPCWSRCLDSISGNIVGDAIQRDSLCDSH
jgi:hypothetical protein